MCYVGAGDVFAVIGANRRPAEDVAVCGLVCVSPSTNVLPDTDGLVCRVGFRRFGPDCDAVDWLAGAGQRCLFYLQI